MKIRINPFLRAAAFAPALLIAITMAQSASAATGTWSGAFNGTWDTTATNWSDVSGTPWDNTNGPGNTATFNTASLTAVVSGPVDTNGITFSTTGAVSGSTINLVGTVNGGRLVLLDNTAGTSNFTTNAELEFQVTTGYQMLSANGTLSGSGNLIKTGPGEFRLGGWNGGQTISLASGTLIDVHAGTLRNDYGNNAWGANRSDLNVATTATFDIWDVNTTVDAITGAGTIHKGWGTSNSFTIGVDNGSGTFSGSILNGAGGMTLIKDGTGTQTFTGTNTYNGATTVSNGTLALVGGSQASPITVSAGASLGFTLGSPTTSSSSFNLTAGTVKFTGVPDGTSSYTLITASTGITGTPTLHGPVSGYILAVDGNSLKLVPGIASDYSSWVTANSVTGGENDDDDNDGLSNFDEYAFGLDPTGGSSVNPIAAQLDKATGTFSYTRRDSALTTLSYSVWYSTSLEAGSWIEDTGVVEGTPVLSGDVETVPVTISNSLLSNPKLFIQVRAE